MNLDTLKRGDECKKILREKFGFSDYQLQNGIYLTAPRGEDIVEVHYGTGSRTQRLEVPIIGEITVFGQ